MTKDVKRIKCLNYIYDIPINIQLTNIQTDTPEKIIPFFYRVRAL